MESLADILESDLTEAVEVKNHRSLHRYITLLTENLVQQKSNDKEHSEFREAIIRIDTRIEEGFRRMDERFAGVDKRFESLQKAMDERFESLQRSMDERFAAVDKRFESLQRSMDERFAGVDKRFESVDKRFDDMNKRFTMLVSFMSLGFVLLATLMSVYQFLG